MGLLRFHYPAPLVDDWPEKQQGYLVGVDGRIYPTRVEHDGQYIGYRRDTSESCKLTVPFAIPGHGRPILQTTSLIETNEPYQLQVELARGKLVQIRNQAAQWELAGMYLPVEYAAAAHAAHQFFAKAACAKDDEFRAADFAMRSLVAACDAGLILARAYYAQALAGRQQRYPNLPALLSCDVGMSVLDPVVGDHFCEAFNSATIPVPWAEIEPTEGEYQWDRAEQLLTWCESRKLMVRGGPLIDLGPRGLPAWLGNWEQDFFNLQSFVCDFVETAITKFLGRIRLWEIATRMNTGGALSLTEESRLTLVARVLEVARNVDEEAQLVLRVDQPWGDYQALGQHRLAPIQLVDALLRSGVGLTGVNLEIAMGYFPRGTAYRDMIELSRLIDLWSVLGVPLFVTLSCPSSAAPDPLAAADMEVATAVWPRPIDEHLQAEWLADFLPLVMSKPSVAGVAWRHFSDHDPHLLPQSGLLRADQSPKPALQQLIAFRTNYSRRDLPPYPDATP